MRISWQTHAEDKKLCKENVEHGHEAHGQCEFEEKVAPRPLNLILPLIWLITSTFFFFGIQVRVKEQAFLVLL